MEPAVAVTRPVRCAPGPRVGARLEWAGGDPAAPGRVPGAPQPRAAGRARRSGLAARREGRRARSRLAPSRPAARLPSRPLWSPRPGPPGPALGVPARSPGDKPRAGAARGHQPGRVEGNACADSDGAALHFGVPLRAAADRSGVKPPAAWGGLRLPAVVAPTPRVVVSAPCGAAPTTRAARLAEGSPCAPPNPARGRRPCGP